MEDSARLHIKVASVDWEVEESDPRRGLWRVVAPGPHEFARRGEIYVVQDLLTRDVADRMARPPVKGLLATRAARGPETGSSEER